MAVRHPFVARRLVIMVPTLLIISVVSFIIIQLPPSDFLTMRIMHLRMAGDEAAVEEAQQMAALFHVEENSFQHYLRWMGAALVPQLQLRRRRPAPGQSRAVHGGRPTGQ